ncbi:MAG: S8 family serine peptidase [Thermotoga caldifontis]|uniref:S8 family peptidase n=2 Tax=Thermotoga caldifontis TaxID=1508419 RepID=UPI003C7E7C65
MAKSKMFILLALFTTFILILTSCGVPVPPNFSATVYGKVSAYVGDVTRLKSFPASFFIRRSNAPKFIEKQFVVGCRTEVSTTVRHSIEKFGTVLDELSVGDETYFLVRTDSEVPQIREELSKIPGFLSVEPNRVVTVSAIFPNDPYFVQQWNLSLINLPYAWTITTGSDIVTIAVIDSGVDLSHEDLAGIFVPGYDFVRNDSFPDDENGHGTHVTGIIAALTNNSKSVAGVAWGQRVKIMPLKVMDETGTGTVFNFAKALVYAVDHGAKIINVSLGASQPSSVEYSAVKYAYENDVIMVCAAGNDGSYGVDYPAAYPETIAVGAVTIDGVRASYSDYGPELDVVAPGGDEQSAVLSTFLGNTYDYWAGTSMATPHVTGLVALMVSQGIVGVENVRNVLRRTAVDLGPAGYDIGYGAGLVDAYAALTWQDGWEPLVVFGVDENGNVDSYTVADGLGRFQLTVRKPRVKIYAWMDFDGDDAMGVGDLYGYYGYVGGDPRTGSPIVLSLEMNEIREINFNIAPIVDTTHRPVLSAKDAQTLSDYKKDVIEQHYRSLRK